MIAFIDGDSIAYIAGADKVEKDTYTNERVVLEKDEEICKEQIHSILDEIIKNTGAKGYLLFLTGPGNFRKTVYPDYKANRKGLEPPRMLNFCKQYLQTLPGVYLMEGIEADDAVSIYKNMYDTMGKESIICSPDKDVLMLPGKHFNYRKMEFVVTNEAEAEYTFWTDMIAGQSGDNIKGIPGKGPAFAKKLFEENPSVRYRTSVLNAYIDHFGEREGIYEFYKNYMVLKIMTNPQDLLETNEPYLIPVDINSF
jgi:DNA polymerase-1